MHANSLLDVEIINPDVCVRGSKLYLSKKVKDVIR